MAYEDVYRSLKIRKQLLVQGTLDVVGVATFEGTVTFEDDVTVEGTVTFEDVEFAGDTTFTLESTEAITITASDVTAPLVMTNTITTAGKVGGRALFITATNVAMGSYANGVKGYWQATGTSGAVTGLASGVCGEIKTANATLPSGAYYALEAEYVAGGTSTTSTGSGSRVGFIYMENSVDLDGDFDDNGYLFTAAGLTAGAGNILSANDNTLRIQVGLRTAETTKYLLLSDSEDCLAIDSCTTAITIGDNVTNGVVIGNATTGINLDGDFTDAIIIAGSNTIVDGIEIGICTTNAINIAVQTTTGIRFAGGGAYNPIHIGTKSNTASQGLVMVGVLDDMGGIMVFCDDGGVDLTNSWTTSPLWNRYVITADQTSNTATGAYLQLKTQGARALTSCDYSAVKAYLEVNGTMSLTTADLATINVTLEYAGNITNTSGSLAGINIDINDKGSYSITDTAVDSAGIIIRKVSGSTAGWPVGLKINDTGAVTGIKIGDCTTGILLDGDFTTGLSLIAEANADDMIKIDAESTMTITDGIEFTGAGTYTKGINFNVSGTLTMAIDIGACTTGIAFTSTMGTGIDFSDATLTPDTSSTDIAIGLGTRANDMAVAFASGAGVENFEPIQMNVTFSGSNPDSVSKVNMIYQNLTHVANDMANLRLKCADFTINAGKNCRDLYIHQGEIIISGSGITVGNEVAGIGLVVNAGASAVTCGTYNGINITMRGAGTPAQASGLMIHGTGSCTLPYGISIYGTPQPTIGICLGNYANDNQGPTHAFFFPSGPGADQGPVVNTVEAGDGAASIKIKIGSTTKYLHYWDNAA